MKILVVSQYFWPENFRINDLVKEWNKDKFQVEILTGIPNYPSGVIFENYKKIKIILIFMKQQKYIEYQWYLEEMGLDLKFLLII